MQRTLELFTVLQPFKQIIIEPAVVIDGVKVVVKRSGIAPHRRTKRCDDTHYR